MKYMNNNKKMSTRVIVALTVAASVLSMGVGAAAMKVASMKRETPVQIEATMPQNNENQEVKVVTTAHTEKKTDTKEIKSVLRQEAEKWFSTEELAKIKEADLAEKIQERKTQYSKYLNAEELKLSYEEKAYLYEKRDAEAQLKAAEEKQRKAAEANAVMTLDIVDMTMRTGEKVTLKAALTPAVKNATYSWTMNDSSIATVTPNGSSAVITAKAVGTTTVTVTNGTSKATCIVRVKAAETFYLNVGHHTMMTGDAFTATASSKIASVKSSDNNVASASFDGTAVTVYGKNPGSATITVTGKNGKSAAMTVNVNAYALSMSASRFDMNVGEGRDLYITSGNAAKWFVEGSDVLRITANGNYAWVEAIGEGTAKVTAAAADGTRVSCTVYVSRPVVQLKVDASYMDLNKGELGMVHVIQGSASNWYSSNENVARVYAIGDGSAVQIEAIGAGTATITASSNNGTTANVTVNVTAPAPAPELKLSATNLTVKAGEIIDLRVISGAAESWTISNENLADLFVIGDGSLVQIQGKQAGNLVINAYSIEGKCASVNVTVIEEKVLAENFEPICEMVCEPLYMEEAPVAVAAVEPIIEEAPAAVESIIEEAPAVIEMAAEMVEGM